MFLLLLLHMCLAMEEKHSVYHHLLSTILVIQLIVAPQLSYAIDFVFNGFSSSDLSLYGNAYIRSRILTLTTFSFGGALYPSKIATKQPHSSFVLPFSTSFIFATAPNKVINPDQRMNFLFVPHTNSGIDTQNGTYDYDFRVRFDVLRSQNLVDYYTDAVVAIHVNEDKSPNVSDADQMSSVRLKNGRNYQVWIDYADFQINVTLEEAGMTRPETPLISTIVNLSQPLKDEMSVGFTAATGAAIENHMILGWSFSNDNFSLSRALITHDLPSFEFHEDPVYKSKWFTAGLTAGVIFLLVTGTVVSILIIMRKNRRKMEAKEDWELEYWPHRISYQEVAAATRNFSAENVVGVGGNGKVYRGVLAGGAEVAVKHISPENSGEGMREFVSEISSLGRLRHKNLVGLRGWCKERKGSLILVYDYMENGSLDKRLFEFDDENKMLNWAERIRILKDAASALLYLHEGWDSKVLHRDIKASNVLLDRELNARLGDFGLARVQDDHGTPGAAGTTRVVGTVGYLAPELVRNGRPSTQSDVYSFGVLILEVICGRRPIEHGKQGLVDWVVELARKGRWVDAVEERLRTADGFNQQAEEMERVIHLALSCTQPEPCSRPSMRQVMKILENNRETINEVDAEIVNAWLLRQIEIAEESTTHSSVSVSWCNSLEVGR